jgi:hypothetical protein
VSEREVCGSAGYVGSCHDLRGACGAVEWRQQMCLKGQCVVMRAVCGVAGSVWCGCVAAADMSEVASDVVGCVRRGCCLLFKGNVLGESQLIHIEKNCVILACSRLIRICNDNELLK